MISERNGTPIPRLDIITPAACDPEVTVELEPGVVSGGRRENKKVKLLVYSMAVLQHYVR